MPAMSSMRLTTTKLCPPRPFSRRKAVRMVASSHSAMAVLIGWRRAGGVAMIDSCCNPTSAVCNVRGMGVALSDRTCVESPPRARRVPI